MKLSELGLFVAVTCGLIFGSITILGSATSRERDEAVSLALAIPAEQRAGTEFSSQMLVWIPTPVRARLLAIPGAQDGTWTDVVCVQAPEGKPQLWLKGNGLVRGYGAATLMEKWNGAGKTEEAAAQDLCQDALKT